MQANHFKVFTGKTTTSGIPARRRKNTDHGPNTGFYGPLIIQSEWSIWQISTAKPHNNKNYKLSKGIVEAGQHKGMR